MASAQQSCKNYRDVSFYICGYYTLSVDTKNITGFLKRAYKAYFDAKLGDKDKSSAPFTVCKTCVEYLRQWTKGAKHSPKFWDSDGVEEAIRPCIGFLLLYHQYNWYQPEELAQLPVCRLSICHCEKILIPPLQMKLGLIKQFMHALKKDGSIEKMKAGICDCPQIRQLIKDKELKNSLNTLGCASGNRLCTC
ncbi:hypothetical protein QYM36_016257 [Artemia franciscana]|uniref:Uncharacterized protein n=1 Tax=Artemia franciscana TaxID=6661 RepID=A0AA88HEU3_ARTSF|nr:hypothetical protein QYM36_016257 [Artemia franciscana]